MDFLSLSEELEGIDRHLITFHSEACIHATRRFAECALCHTVCPVDAILPNENLPIFDQNKCVKCKACLPVCPMGAFQATDSVLNLLKCVSRFKPHSIEIVCEKHSASEEAVPNSEVAFQIQGCLAGLGSGAYIALFALGVESVIARTDLCKTCEWGALRTHIDSQIEDARTFLGAWEWEGKLSSISELPENNDHERPVWNTENLPVSRRDLFRLSSQQSDFTLARELAGDLKEKQHHPSLNRTRLIASLGILIQSNPPVQDIHLENMGFAKITVDETCTACGACARICPTKALNLESDTKNKTYRLSFTPELCIDCGVCLHACMPHSITLESNPTFQYVFENKEPITLRDGSLTRCEGCKVWFASHLGEELCPGCAYRKENLYGSMIPRDWQPGTMGPYKPDKPSKEQAPSGSDT
jgi:ferredoxin